MWTSNNTNLSQASSRGRYLSWQELQYQQQLSVMSSSSKKFSKLSFWSTSVPVRFQGWSTRVTSWDINCLRHICQIFYIGSTNSGDGEFQKESRKPKRFSVDLLPKPGCWESCLLFAHFIGFFSKINKSKCQLYKRLAEPIISLFLVWSGLEKGFQL